jgi:hypothetical protein
MDVLQNIVGQKSKPWSGLKALTVGGWGDWELFDLEKAMVAVRTNVVEGSVAAEPRQGALVSFISKSDPSWCQHPRAGSLALPQGYAVLFKTTQLRGGSETSMDRALL